MPGIETPVTLRSVLWEAIPLGSVIVGWPRIHNASIPELLGYPLVTESLRSALYRKYQFLRGHRVTIADPSSGLVDGDVLALSREAGRIIAGASFLTALSGDLRSSLLRAPDVREGLLRLPQYEGGPYTLVKDWMRSVSATIRDASSPAHALWGPSPESQSPEALLASLLTGSLRALPQSGATLVDIGLDVSASMALPGKTQRAWSSFLALLGPLSTRLGASEFRLWLVSGSARQIEWRRGETTSFASLVAHLGIEPGETCFAPFLREVLHAEKAGQRHLAILITDGVCSDRALSLRLLEKIAKAGTEYVQVILHEDEENRAMVDTAGEDRGADGVISDREIRETDRVTRRTDGELEAFSRARLEEVTDLAEAARGGQLVLTWYPAFDLVALDLYTRWLGRVMG